MVQKLGETDELLQRDCQEPYYFDPIFSSLAQRERLCRGCD